MLSARLHRCITPDVAILLAPLSLDAWTLHAATRLLGLRTLDRKVRRVDGFVLVCPLQHRHAGGGLHWAREQSGVGAAGAGGGGAVPRRQPKVLVRVGPRTRRRHACRVPRLLAAALVRCTLHDAAPLVSPVLPNALHRRAAAPSQWGVLVPRAASASLRRCHVCHRPCPAARGPRFPVADVRQWMAEMVRSGSWQRRNPGTPAPDFEAIAAAAAATGAGAAAAGRKAAVLSGRDAEAAAKTLQSLSVSTGRPAASGAQPAVSTGRQRRASDARTASTDAGGAAAGVPCMQRSGSEVKRVGALDIIAKAADLRGASGPLDC